MGNQFNPEHFCIGKNRAGQVPLLREFKRDGTRFLKFPTIAMALLLFSTALLGSACAKKDLLKTENLVFRCDSNFNEGLRLPVDLVFVPDGENVKTVTNISPDNWFDSDEREQWQFKQSLSLVESNERQDVEVKLKKPGSAVALVIYVDYRSIQTAKGQVIVLDGKAKELENVFITTAGILHQNR